MGLIERKERPKVKEEPSPEQGSQLYQTEYTETKRFKHEAFLADVVGKSAGGKHIAIIGEPGAGKTTILTKIGAWLIQQAEQQSPAPLVVAWISLAGSHIRLTTQSNGQHHITIPAHDPLKIGTLNTILRSVAEHLGLTKDEFIIHCTTELEIGLISLNVYQSIDINRLKY